MCVPQTTAKKMKNFAQDNVYRRYGQKQTMGAPMTISVASQFFPHENPVGISPIWRILISFFKKALHRFISNSDAILPNFCPRRQQNFRFQTVKSAAITLEFSEKPCKK